MANESGGVVFAQNGGALPPVTGGIFPKEFKRGVLGRFDRRFSLMLLICGAVCFTTVAILSMKKPSQTVSEKEITQIQERYARLVLNQPKPVIEEKVTEVAETETAGPAKVEKEEEKKEEVKVDRKKETFVEKEKRRESGAEHRKMKREQAAEQVQTAGIFAAITASGSGGTGTSDAASDLLGTAGLGVTNLGSMKLSKGTFATKNVDPEALVARKGKRPADVDIQKEGVGRTAVTTVASNVKVNVTTQAPEVSGESSSLQERSQSAIQKVVSRQSRRLKRLYEEWLKRDPSLSGRLTIRFVILPSGSVANISVVKTTTENTDFDAMVIRYIKRWRFPDAPGAGPVEVVYPFVFEGQS